MADKVINMSKLKQVLMLYSERNKHPERKMSNRSIAQTVGLDKTTVNKYIKLAEKDPEGITSLLTMDEREAIESLLAKARNATGYDFPAWMTAVLLLS